MNVAVIGAGYWGRNHVRVFSSLPGVKLRWVCDRSSTALKSARSSASPSARFTLDSVRVLQDDSLDAVVVVTDVPNHFNVAYAALQAGKHVFVEKPLTLDVGDAETLVKIAQERNLCLMVGHLFEYHPAILFIKKLIKSGELGDLRYIYCQRLNLGVVRSAENAWESLAPHDISIACSFFDDMPETISATGGSFLQGDIEDVVFASLRFRGGGLVHIHVSWLDPCKVRRVVFVGSKKMIVFDDMHPTERVRIYNKGVEISKATPDVALAVKLVTGDVYAPRIDVSEPLEQECKHFVHCVQSGDKPVSDGVSGERVVRVLVGGNQSMRQRGATVGLL